MKSNKLITHEILQERSSTILELIDYAERRIDLKTDSLNGFGGTFPELHRKYLKDLEITKLAHARLWNAYGKTIAKIQEGLR